MREKKSNIKTINLPENYFKSAERLYPEAFGKNKFSETIRRLLEKTYPLVTESNYLQQRYREIEFAIEEKANIIRKLNVELDDLKWQKEEYIKKIEKQIKEKQEVEEQMWNNSI